MLTIVWQWLLYPSIRPKRFSKRLGGLGLCPYLVGGALLLLYGCSSSPSFQPQKGALLTSFTGVAMTVPYRIVVGRAMNREEENLVEKTILETFQEVDRIYNKWNPHSEISIINRLPAATAHRLSHEMRAFLKRVDHLVQLSQNRFDPTVEPLQQLWKRHLERGDVPREEEIEALKPVIGWHTLRIEEGVLLKKEGGTQLDFGGVAKGYCVDLLVENLRALNLESLYVEWGGEIRTAGFHPEKRPWHVCIGCPSPQGSPYLIGECDLVESAIATSGDYFQYWQVQGADGQAICYCHIFNPKTLMPLEVKKGSVASASLLASDCLTADALAKVLMLFPSAEEAEEWAEGLRARDPRMRFWIVKRQ